MEILARKSSKARSFTALIWMLISMLVTILIILDWKLSGRTNFIAGGLGFISITAFFGFAFYALIYSLSDALQSYEFLPDRLIIKSTVGKDKPETVVLYADIVKIKTDVPLWGNFPRENYANFKILTAAKTFELEAVKDWEAVFFYLFEQSSKLTGIPIESLQGDAMTALLYSQASKNRLER